MWVMPQISEVLVLKFHWGALKIINYFNVENISAWCLTLAHFASRKT